MNAPTSAPSQQTPIDTTTRHGTLYLLPNRLAEGDWRGVLPHGTAEVVAHCQHYIVENAKPARAWLKSLFPELNLRELKLYELTQGFDPQCLAPLEQGEDMVLMSDAGCPGVADPGSVVVLACHERGLKVYPLVGPSSLLLTLMASGLQGQRFAFHGYVPVASDERLNCLQKLAHRSATENETQILIETPYRNAALWQALLQGLSPSTWLTVAIEVTGPQQQIATRRVAQWRQEPMPEFDRRPTVFAFLTTEAAKASSNERPMARAKQPAPKSRHHAGATVNPRAAVAAPSRPSAVKRPKGR